jgi:flagellar protein FliO/FliZ
MDLATVALRVAVSLVVVLGLVWLLAKGARRRGLGSGLDTSRFTVIGRHSLGRNAGVTVVRVGDEALVLGVTEQHVTLLATVPAGAVTTSSVTSSATTDPAAAAEAGAPSEVHLPQDPAVAGARRASPLAGSALSAATWTQALDGLRERTTRR